MNTLQSIALLAFAATLAAGCSGTSTPMSPSSVDNTSTPTATLIAGDWTLVSIQPSDGTVQPAPVGATYTLTLTNGRLSTRADCNTCGGTFALSGTTLTAGPAIACTRAACPTMTFEQAYTAMLSGNSTVALSGNTLALSSPRGTLRFTR